MEERRSNGRISLIYPEFSISSKFPSQKIGVIVLVFKTKECKLVRNPCDISARPWEGTEICDSREGKNERLERMLISVDEKCESYVRKIVILSVPP